MGVMKQKNNALDAMLLAVIRILTILVNLLSSAILARKLDLVSFGTYTAGNLIVTVAASATLLGMMDAANYFYHQDTYARTDCLNTIFFVQLALGILCGGLILAFQNSITGYFNNPMLKGVYIYIAFRPMLTNLYSSLLTLQMSVGRSRAVALRNVLMAVTKLGVVFLTVYVTNEIVTIFGAYLVLDTLTIIYYYSNFKKAAFPIRPHRFRKELLKPILQFSIPMGIYVMTNSLARDIDKLVIGKFESTEQLAVYSNCAAALPFDIVSAAFLTIMIPIMTRLIQQGELERGRNLFRAYLKIGYLSTFLFTGACIILSKEVIQLLYGDKYLAGQNVFILYTLVDMAKFASVSLVLSAKGKTKTLMGISVGTLLANLILNLIFYRLWGFVGPAIATVVVTLGSTLILLQVSANVLQTKAYNLVDLRQLAVFVVKMLVIGAIALLVRNLMVDRGSAYPVVLVVVGCLFGGTMLLLNRREMLQTLHELNKEHVENYKQ